jgi:hypothetical protein
LFTRFRHARRPRHNTAVLSEGDGLTADDLDREAVAASRRTAPAEKFRAGLDLFDRTSRIMAAGIRDEQPQADDATVLRLIRERLRLARTLETR